MALTRRALRTEVAVLEANLRTANAEVANLREQLANLRGQQSPSYDDRIRLARRAEDAEARPVGF
jgi:predicted  nucleic acid-binding Zn-ribbon protein